MLHRIALGKTAIVKRGDRIGRRGTRDGCTGHAYWHHISLGRQTKVVSRVICAKKVAAMASWHCESRSRSRGRARLGAHYTFRVDIDEIGATDTHVVVPPISRFLASLDKHLIDLATVRHAFHLTGTIPAGSFCRQSTGNLFVTGPNAHPAMLVPDIASLHDTCRLQQVLAAPDLDPAAIRELSYDIILHVGQYPCCLSFHHDYDSRLCFRAPAPCNTPSYSHPLRDGPSSPTLLPACYTPPDSSADSLAHLYPSKAWRTHLASESVMLFSPPATPSLCPSAPQPSGWPGIPPQLRNLFRDQLREGLARCRKFSTNTALRQSTHAPYADSCGTQVRGSAHQPYPRSKKLANCSLAPGVSVWQHAVLRLVPLLVVCVCAVAAVLTLVLWAQHEAMWINDAAQAAYLHASTARVKVVVWPEPEETECGGSVGRDAFGSPRTCFRLHVMSQRKASRWDGFSLQQLQDAHASRNSSGLTPGEKASLTKALKKAEKTTHSEAPLSGGSSQPETSERTSRHKRAASNEPGANSASSTKKLKSTTHAAPRPRPRPPQLGLDGLGDVRGVSQASESVVAHTLPPNTTLQQPASATWNDRRIAPVFEAGSDFFPAMTWPDYQFQEDSEGERNTTQPNEDMEEKDDENHVQADKAAARSEPTKFQQAVEQLERPPWNLLSSLAEDDQPLDTNLAFAENFTHPDAAGGSGVNKDPCELNSWSLPPKLRSLQLISEDTQPAQCLSAGETSSGHVQVLHDPVTDVHTGMTGVTRTMPGIWTSSSDIQAMQPYGHPAASSFTRTGFIASAPVREGSLLRTGEVSSVETKPDVSTQVEPWPAFTDIIRTASATMNGSRRTVVNLLAQSPQIVRLVKASYPFIAHHIYFVSAFPGDQTSKVVRSAVVAAVKAGQPDTDVFARRMAQDPGYASQIDSMANTHVPYLRKCFKEHAELLVPIHYSLPLDTDEAFERKMETLIHGNAFIFPSSHNGNTTVINRGEPFQNSIGIKLLQRVLTRDFVEKNNSHFSFVRNADTGKQEYEVPLPLLGVAYSAVYNTLDNYRRLGLKPKKLPVNFSADAIPEVYVDILATLDLLRDNRSEAAVHKLLHGLFLRVVAQPAQDRPKTSTIIDFSAMECLAN
ncbi:hypothetical protein K488DRAFT_69739 [Vararia minispora EC-137]|uniref:Uncharacterized protein n=1 Tax=Vararia minispora EC-137 TaxID=1314806 RepID=A0ACB8QP58_9AGAM|nr:hypothetical protein K488DRAFT_69739 [Vararia minispora EC-137]